MMYFNRTLGSFLHSFQYGRLLHVTATVKAQPRVQPAAVIYNDFTVATVHNHFKKNNLPSMANGLDKLYHIKVFTDDWLNIQSMIVTYYEWNTQFALVYSTNPCTVSTLLNSSNIIDPNLNAIIRSNISIKELINYQSLELPKMIRYVHCSIPQKEKCLPEGLQFDNIQLSDLDLIVSKWHCKTWPGSRDLLYHFITAYPNVGIYDMSSTYTQPRLISWVLSSGLGIINHLYTLREYSGQGLGTAIIKKLTNKLLLKGFVPQADVSENNTASRALLSGCGFNKSCSLFC